MVSFRRRSPLPVIHPSSSSETPQDQEFGSLRVSRSRSKKSALTTSVLIRKLPHPDVLLFDVRMGICKCLTIARIGCPRV